MSAHAFLGGADVAYLATGTAFRDALAGEPLRASKDASMLLTSRAHSTRPPGLSWSDSTQTGSALPGGTRTELTWLSPDTAYVLGVRAAQRNEIPREVQRRLGICWSATRPSAGGQEVIASVPGATKQVAYTLDVADRRRRRPARWR